MPKASSKRTGKPSPDSMRKHACEAAGLMKALSNENRLIVLCALAEGDSSRLCRWFPPKAHDLLRNGFRMSHLGNRGFLELPVE